MALHPRLRERPHRARPTDEPTPRERVLALREAHPHLSSRALAARARVPRSSAQRWLREAAEDRRTAERTAALLASDRAGAGVAGTAGGCDAPQADSGPTSEGSEVDRATSAEWELNADGVPAARAGRHPCRSGPGDPFVGHPRDRGLPGWTNPWLR